MNRFLLAVVVSCFVIVGSAQNFEWARGFGGNSGDNGISVTTGTSGNVYCAGTFSSSVDFDPGPDTSIMVATGYEDVFFSKFSPAGVFIWSKQIKGAEFESIKKIVTDQSENIFIIGEYHDTVDFDPGPGDFYLATSAAAIQDIYIAKYDSSGNFKWARRFGASTSGNYGFSIKADDHGNLIACGEFQGTMDFDPDTTVNNISSQFSSDLFIIKLDTGGNLKWIKTIKGNSAESAKDVTIDHAGNYYITGLFAVTADFNPDSLMTYNLSPPNYGVTSVYILKLDSAGNFIWVKSIGGPQFTHVTSIVVDGSDKLYLGGGINGSTDMNPGSGTYYLTPQGNQDAFLCKLDSAGNLIWANKFSGSQNERVNGIAIDNAANLFIAGYFEGTVDLDPGPGTYQFTGQSWHDIFICKLDSSCNLFWATAIESEDPNGITVDNLGNMYCTGLFANSIDFDPGIGSQLLVSNGVTDVFLSKYANSCSQVNLVIDSVNDITCTQPGFASAFTIGGNSPYSIQWNTNPITNDSTAIFTSTGLYQVTYSDTNNCVVQKTALISGPSALIGFDLKADLVAGNFRPGFDANIWMETENDACDTVSGVFSIVIDSLVTFNYSSPPPDLISGDTLFWDFSAWNYDSAHITPIINVTTSTSAQIGDTVCFDVFINPIAGDADSSNNYKTYCFPVVNGYDPNDISVYPPGTCAEGYVLDDQKLTYTIRFQNTGNSHAVNINVLDSLYADLDLSSVRLIANSHPMITEVLPGNVLKFRFDNIMLPDSGSHEVGSHGYVIYEVDPLPSLANGTQIKNQANIYFDFNPPVITNEVMNTIIDSIPSCSITNSVSSVKSSEIKIYPNPAKDLLYIENLTANSTINLFDCSGRLTLTERANTNKVAIHTNSLDNGVYVLEITDSNSRYFSKVIVGH